jgi:gas vesicle protein
MASQEIQHKVLPEKTSIEKLAELVSDQTKRIEELQDTIDQNSSWKSKSVDYLAGGVVGAIIGFVLTLLLT